MIDVTEFTDKLDRLVGYMEYWVTAKRYNELYCSPKGIMDFFDQTGIILQPSRLIIQSFEQWLKTEQEWLQLNTTNTINKPLN